MTRLRAWRSALRTPVGAAAAVALAALLAIAVLGPVLWGAAAARTDTAAIQQGPTAAHPVGTDALGRDVLARVLVATRLSVALALLAVVIGVAAGLALGALPSVLGQRVGRLVTAAVNLAVAFPGLLLALFFAVIFGAGTKGAVLAIGLASAPSFARLTQTLASSIAGRDYVAAARIAGVGRLRLLRRHVLPNIAEPLVVNATIGAGGALLAFAGLSFLGLGVQPPAYDWGRLLHEGLNRIYLNPLAALAPGAAVVLAGLAFGLFGEAVAQVAGLRTPPVRPGSPVPAAEEAEPAVDPAAGGCGAAAARVADLRVSFPTPAGWSTPVNGVSFDIGRGECVGIVGESGSGKTLTALAVAGLVAPPGAVRARRLEVAGVDLLATPARELPAALGTSLAMVFQDPMTSLNPALRIGRQLAEVAEVHEGLSRRAARDRAVARLAEVRVDAPARRLRQYPHELSGGMRQRAMIAMGLMGRPRLVVADEPTSALDVTVQRQVLRLLRQVREESGAAVLLVSHDIAVVSQVCDRVLVMYGGTLMEDLPAAALRTGPAHPYTRALLASVPGMDTDRHRPLATIPGQPPEPTARPPGCPFAPRCPHADARCRTERPPLTARGPAHQVACWHPREPDRGAAEPPRRETAR